MSTVVMGDNSPASATAGYDYRLFDVTSLSFSGASGVEFININEAGTEGTAIINFGSFEVSMICEVQLYEVGDPLYEAGGYFFGGGYMASDFYISDLGVTNGGIGGTSLAITGATPNSISVLDIFGGETGFADSGNTAGFINYMYSGADDVTGTAFDDYFRSAGGADNVFGGAGKDSLFGEAGADKLYGEGGTDKLYGGLDGDTLDGGSSADSLYGSDGSDTIYGGTSGDLIHGDKGNDKLYGGTGSDIFVFDTALSATTNVDKFYDYSVYYDTIQLDNDVFTRAGPLGRIASDAFHTGTTAGDAEDRIIYNVTDGKLYYDKDGLGGVNKVLFAQLEPQLLLGYKDFEVIG